MAQGYELIRKGYHGLQEFQGQQAGSDLPPRNGLHGAQDFQGQQACRGLPANSDTGAGGRPAKAAGTVLTPLPIGTTILTHIPIGGMMFLQRCDLPATRQHLQERAEFHVNQLWDISVRDVYQANLREGQLRTRKWWTDVESEILMEINLRFHNPTVFLDTIDMRQVPRSGFVNNGYTQPQILTSLPDIYLPCITDSFSQTQLKERTKIHIDDLIEIIVREDEERARQFWSDIIKPHVKSRFVRRFGSV